MENAGVTSETSVRRQKRSKGLDGSDGDPSKSNQSPNEADQEASGEDSFEDHADEVAPKAKRKRGAAREAADEPGIDQSLIDVIKYNGKLIQSAVKCWVERYERDSKSAMAELLMTLFEACGAKFQLDAGSLDETDVDDVVVSLVNLSKNGDVEDLYSSKRREIKNFKENLVSFWDNLILECQNGPLFDKVLFEKCMDYVIALSCTPPRVYRQVATLLGLQFVTSFITIAKRLSSQRETTQRQLNAEKKKRNDNPRVESLDKRLSSTHEKITLMEEMMRKIFTGLFMHRYRDIDSDIRLSCIKSLGVWIMSYPSLFLQDLYLKYLGWTLNDKSAGVRKTSIQALQNLYEVDDIVPSLGLFTERFCNRMIELADDIDISVAVSAIGLLKQLLRHQLLHEDELGPLYDLLIDEPPAIRRATGELVYDHLIAQKRSGPQSGSRGGVDESSEIHLGRLLQIVEGFSADPILIAYVVDDVWDDMKALKDWKCIISLLLDEKPSIELTDIDTTNLVRFLHASARKAVGEKIVPAIDNRKQYLTKAQKEALENNRGDITAALIKRYPQLLRKYVADKAKVSLLVEMVTILKLELYSLKRQEQNFKIVIQLIKDAFFKHGERDALRSCIKAINFCSNESQADLQDYSQSKLKELEDELINKLKSSMKEVAVGDDEYSLLINLKRLYEVQLTKNVPIDGLFEDMDGILRDLQDTNDEVISFLLLNMFLHVAWSLQSIDVEDSSEEAVSSLLSKRAILFERLEYFLDTLPEAYQGRNGSHLACRICIILAELWCLFKKSNYTNTILASLGYSPDISTLKNFWRLCEQQLNISDETDDEDANEDYIEDTNRDAVMIAAAKLVSGDVVPKDYLGPEIVSHFALHGTSVCEIIKHLISVIKKSADDDISALFLEAMKRAYHRHVVETSLSDESSASKSFLECKDLASRLSGTFVGAARNKHRLHILKIVKEGVSFAFVDIPKQLPFLECAVLQFVNKLPTSDVLDILKDVQKKTENINTDEDPSGWRPYFTFVDHLREKYGKTDGDQEEKEEATVKRRGRPRKARNIQGKKLFDGQSSSEGEDSISASDPEDQDEEDREEDEPLINSIRSASKLRFMKLSQKEATGAAGTSKTSDHHTPIPNTRMLMEEKEDYDLTIMSSLLSLTPTQFSHLIHSLSSELLIRRHRLHLLLSSPPLFSSALRHIDSLSLPDKSALLARLLLRSLRLLALDPLTTAPARCLRDLDAGLLLLAMCDAHGSSGAGDWRARVVDHVTRAELLGPWGLGAGPWAVVGPHVDSAVKCRRLLRAANGGKAGREAAASVAVVVALPSVEGSGSEDCSVCREEMGRGRSVCGLPCKHAFHWGCILPWLEKKNTCPCCRLELPSDDVFCEIGRLWRVLVRRGNSTTGSDR